MTNTALAQMQPKNVACIGRMDSGKSYLLRMILRAANRSLFVYNAGRASDWQDCLLIELEVEDQQLYFWYEEERYEFDQYMTLFRGQSVKCFGDEEAEPWLWKALGQQRGYPFAGLSLVVDDASGILASGRLTKAQKRFLSKSKHLGLEVYLVFHGFEFVPIKTWSLLTHAVVFITNVPPRPHLAEQLGASTYRLLHGVYHLLQQADTFCYARINFNKMSWQVFGRGGTRFKAIHKKQETVFDNEKIELLKMAMPVLESIIDGFLLKPFQHVSAQYEVPMANLLGRIHFSGDTLFMRAYQNQNVLLKQSLTVDQCIEHIVGMDLEQSDASGLIPAAVTQTLQIMGINIRDLINRPFLTALLSGELIPYKTLYLAAPRGRIVYLVRNEQGTATPIKFTDLWQL